jgi:hypothetical protein
MPSSKAQAKTDLQATGLNPYGSLAVAGGQNATITMTFETGRNPNLPGLLDAIETFYGAGKVTSDGEVTAHSAMRLRVAA